jgi:hypothetical protein
VELAPEKQQLHAQQRDERAERLAALDHLQAEYHQELEHYRRQVRKKAFTHEITRARRYHEEKSFWEYLNNIVEDIHLFTWRKTVTASCTDNYQRKRYRLEQELRELDAQHRKERIILRYDRPIKSEERARTCSRPNPMFSYRNFLFVEN